MCLSDVLPVKADDDQPWNQSRMSIEPAPNSPSMGVIDPKDPQAARRFQIQQRGGLYKDRIKYQPYTQMDSTFRPKQPLRKS